MGLAPSGIRGSPRSPNDTYPSIPTGLGDGNKTGLTSSESNNGGRTLWGGREDKGLIEWTVVPPPNPPQTRAGSCNTYTSAMEDGMFSSTHFRSSSWKGAQGISMGTDTRPPRAGRITHKRAQAQAGVQQFGTGSEENSCMVHPSLQHHSPQHGGVGISTAPQPASLPSREERGLTLFRASATGWGTLLNPSSHRALPPGSPPHSPLCCL